VLQYQNSNFLRTKHTLNLTSLRSICRLLLAISHGMLDPLPRVLLLFSSTCTAPYGCLAYQNAVVDEYCPCMHFLSLVSIPVLTPRINFRYSKNSTWSIPINPNQKTCYCNAQINFQEQHNRSDINKTWTPIMSQQMTNQKTYQRRTPKKNYNTFFRLNFVTCLPKHSTVTLSRASPSLIIKEGIPRWLSHKLILNEVMQV